ncbi:response regulator [Candidatus Parcubacteria bacterium]|nr:response regulator [Patescibacteria group bacterium]MBU4466816.1 response regulator [Patescibacteria group bacterium]MCG2688119.1 response regulator [Candidatus Parcubacteria bacterium]
MKKILIVEDEEIMLNLLEKKLKTHGYKVFSARDGELGLSFLREQDSPDLILMDLIMPKLDGFSVMAEIQKDDRLKKIPLIVISNSGQPVELNKIKELGAIDWLVKTEFDPQELLEKIKKQLGE